MSGKWRKQTVLVIDDNPTNQMLLAEMLGTEYSLLSASDGRAGIELLDRFRTAISLVLLDLVMPEVDGFEVLTHMRQSEGLSNIPVVIISSIDDQREIQRAYRLGAVEYFERPFDAEIIQRRVHTVLRAYTQFGQYEEQLRQEQLYENLAGVIKVHYDRRADMAELGSYGARLLGLPGELRLERHADFSAFTDDGDRMALVEALHSSSVQSPVVQSRVQLNINGKPRWYQVILRAAWDTSSHPVRYAGCSGVFVDIDDFEQQVCRLTQKAMFDPLTGLLRREYFRQQVTARLSDVNCAGESFLFIFFDLDKFKQANDLYGHAFGDKVLKTVGDRLRATLRDGDIIGRMGGDEFVVFLEYTGDPNVVMQRIFDGVTGPLDDFTVALSMGAAQSGTVGADYDQLQTSADKAMYEAKRLGRGQFVLYNDSMAGISVEAR